MDDTTTRPASASPAPIPIAVVQKFPTSTADVADPVRLQVPASTPPAPAEPVPEPVPVNTASTIAEAQERGEPLVIRPYPGR